MDNSPNGVDLNRFAENRNLAPQAASELFACLDMPVVTRGDRSTGYNQPFFDQQNNKPVSKPQRSLEDDARWLNIAKVLDREGVRGMLISELAATVGFSPNQLSFLLTSGVRQGLVVKLSKKLFMMPRHLIRIKNLTAKLVEQSNFAAFSVAEFREATGLGRNRAVDILESFDSQGITKRVDQCRELLPTATRRFDQLLKQVK